jgi:hypothetical protein
VTAPLGRYLPVLSLVCIFSASSASARTWNIDPFGTGDAPTIQAGIDSAAAGDSVVLAPGTYKEAGNRNIDFKGKGIVVSSSAGAGATIIDCEYAARGFIFRSGEGPNAVISGLTIAHGVHVFFGGGIFCSLASPTISNNVFVGHRASFQGGAVYCDSSRASITNNLFQDNGSQNGGGIWVSGGSDLTLSSNRFVGCNAAGAGGAIACNRSNPLIFQNEFLSNQAADGAAINLLESSPEITDNTFDQNVTSGGGGAVRCEQSSPWIHGNIFTYNVAATGAALHCETASSPVVENNTFDANEGSVAGAGIYCSGFSDATIHANIIVNSSSGSAFEFVDFSLPAVSCCDVFNNAGGDAIPAGSDQDNNFSLDPLFCGNPGSGNYELQSTSPCVPSNHPPNASGCDLIGARGIGCAVSTEVRTWGEVKFMYRGENR